MKLLGKGEQAQVIDEFQLLLKGCTIEALNKAMAKMPEAQVSVVVERMYD